MIFNPTDQATIQFGNVQISIDVATLMDHYLKTVPNLFNFDAPKTAPTLPRLGEVWSGQGGIYAGIHRGRNATPNYHLIVGPAIDPRSWQDAKVWTTGIDVDGHIDFSLPSRTEQRLQFVNVPELFESEYYWSSAQDAASSDCAWVQSFAYGGQLSYHESSEFRARAVRRILIIE